MLLSARVAAATLLATVVWSQPVTAGDSVDDVASLGLTWIDIGERPGDCRVLAETRNDAGYSSKAEPTPLVNPYWPGLYAVGKYQDCPPDFRGSKVTAYERVAVRDGGVRLYAPWGRTYVFYHFPYVDQWGHEMRYRFQWVPQEEF